MSQLEQDFRDILTKNPEIEKCHQEGLVNRRALARYVQKKVPGSSLDAVVAMLRRFGFRKAKRQDFSVFRKMRTSIKDNLVILNFRKSEGLSKRLSTIASETDYSVSETLKIIVGTSSVTLILDETKESRFRKIFPDPIGKSERISEISIQFPDEVIDSKGIIAIISNELFVNDILVSELLTASSELLIYLKEEFVLKAFEIIKRLKSWRPDR